MFDLELLGEGFAKAEQDADSDHWRACKIAHQAKETGRPEWAWVLAKFSQKSDDQIRHRANAYVMYLELAEETNLAEPIRDSLSFSHFSVAYKFRDKTETSRLAEALLQAKMEGLSVREFGGLLAGIFGDDPQAVYMSRLGRYGKETKYLYGLSEVNGVSQKTRRAMLLLSKRLEKET